ncbi:MAG: RNA polymerase sigma factor [Acidobacteriota bacterium]
MPRLLTNPAEAADDVFADPDDWQLLLDRRNHDGVGRLFDRHKDYVFRLACGIVGDRSLAEDVTQEVFLRLARRRRHWTPRARFTTWLYRITVNVARELGRRARKERPLDAVAAEPSSTGRDPALRDLQRALARLSQRQREVVVLRHLEGLSTRETARVLGCREGSVKTHLHRALHRLRDLLASDAEPERTT